jgi:hypothetical protein
MKSLFVCLLMTAIVMASLYVPGGLKSRQLKRR